MNGGSRILSTQHDINVDEGLPEMLRLCQIRGGGVFILVLPTSYEKEMLPLHCLVVIDSDLCCVGGRTAE